MKNGRLDTLRGYGFIGPSLLVILLLTTYPLLYGFFISLYNTDLVKNWDFVGFRYYIKNLSSPEFYTNIWLTLKFTFLVVAGHFVLGIAVAIVLNRKLPGRTLFRAIFMLPWLMPEVCVALIYKWMLNPSYGIINIYLVKFGIIDEPLSWLGKGKLAFATIVFVCIWKGFSLVMILVLAGLSAISPDLYEASDIDGCNTIQKFFFITLPCLKPVLLSSLILDTVWWFKHYTMVWLLTEGGPNNATNIISIDIYKQAFGFFKYGSAASLAVLVFVICYVIGLSYRRVLENEGE